MVSASCSDGSFRSSVCPETPVHFLASEDCTYAAEDGGGLFEDLTTRERCSVDVRPLVSAGRPTRKLSVWKACVSTFKAFIGTGILFMPQAMTNAGWAAAAGLMVFSAAVSMVGIILLGRCHEVCQRSYPEIARTAFGSVGYFIVALQIALSQFCFCVCFLVFTQRTVDHICQTNGLHPPPPWATLLAATLACIPLGWMRRIGKMKYPTIIGDTIIMVVVGYVTVVAGAKLWHDGAAPSVVATNRADHMLTFFGTSVYVFEGIGLVIPIRESMEKPKYFPHVLGGMMAFFLVLLTGFGLVGYLAWGASIDTVVLNEVPGPLGTAAQSIYIVGVLCGYPLIIYPTFSICEATLFTTMPPSRTRQALKNAFRTSVTLVMGLVAHVIAQDLSTFVSLVGVSCCIPLAFIIPALLHMRIIGDSLLSSLAMAILGTILVPLTLYIDFKNWGSS